MKKRGLLALLLLGIYYAGFSQYQPLEPFQKGDRVAFVGNSITEMGYYESYIWLYYMLHFPQERITVFNVGIGGDRAKNMVDRFDLDVLPKKPTVICLTFGMNDSGYYEFLAANADSTAKARIRESYHYFELLQAKLKASSARKIMITSSPYDETVKNLKNYFPKKSLAMLEIAQFQEQAARDNHWGAVDFFRPMTAIALEQQKKDSTFTLTGSDRIHPGNAGHFVMAYLFLKAQGLGDKPVADIDINAGAKKVDKAENCHISNLSVTGEDIQFHYLALSLPYPVDTVPRLWENPHRQSEAIGVIPFYEAFNRELLKITGLDESNYRIKMDGKEIGQWSGVQLAAGINLAALKNTPEYEQAMSVLLLNEERMGLESKLRAYYWLQFDYLNTIGLQFKDTQVAMDSVNAKAGKDWAVASKRDNYRMARYPAVREAWQKEMDVLVDQIYSVNKPIEHLVEIEKAH